MNIRALLPRLATALLFTANTLFADQAAPIQAPPTQTTQAQLSKPKVIIFDVNETLLDLESMRKSVGAALGGREDLLPLWFSTMLHHSLVVSATGDYESFGNIGVAALQMVAEINHIDITQAQAKTAILTPLRSLPPHPDVAKGLAKLKAQGYKLVTLTNSSLEGVQLQLKNAGLSQYFAANLSIESVGVFKPHLSTYQWALKNLGVNADQALMVAAHGWDIAGAHKAGLQTAFIQRKGKVLFPLAAQPHYSVLDINALASALSKLK
ncbi:haloacid dehalogenase type II [Marinagarivorans algicola]|uniref:haloacid dehalogenase type II n=1 Tax=Marinagarivorans algicola TaxID=1513270 RepID=UPI0009EB747D|nr:haloacid dehalogenase type II [Marinagarivorans algicola]